MRSKSKLGATLRALWTWSWLVTLPVCAFFAIWLTNTAHIYREFGLRYDATPMKIGLWETGHDEFRALLRRMRLAAQPNGGRGDQHADDLRTISLYVKEKRLTKLNRDLPYSGFDYVKAGIWDGTRVRDVRVRYRGDFARHWAFPKKSWRVKTDTDALFEGMRAFNLIAPKFPEHLNNYLAYRLAARLDLLVPRTELVHVAVNGKRSGVHLLVEQLEELTLRSNGYMPGDLYSGDLVAKDSYRGVTNWVFEHPGMWEKIAVNNHYPEEHRGPLERLILLLNEYPSEEVSRELAGMMDLNAWARFSVFESLARTFHYDLAHNWRLYYDLNRGKFVPVVWDPVGWANSFRLEPDSPDSKGRLDVVVSRLHGALFSNGDFLRTRHGVLREFYEAGGDVEFLREVDQTIDRTRAALAIDPHMRPPSEAEVGHELSLLRTQIAEVLDRVREVKLEEPGQVRWRSLPEGHGSIALSVEGARPVERVTVSFDQRLEAPTSVTLRCVRRGVPVEIDVSGGVHTDGHRLVIELGLLPKQVHTFARTTAIVTSRKVDTGRGYYELAFSGLPADVLPIEVLADRGRPLPQVAQRVPALRRMDIGSLYSIVPEQARYVPEFWEGTVELRGITELERDLVIAPGTIVRLHPGASLVARGRILAEGTERRPIRFVPADPEAALGAEPWGAVALQGPGTRGSRFVSCEFSGGSGLKDPLREYSAMFSVHDTADVRIEACTFADSFLVDDMVHAVYSEIEFVGCTFRRSLSDALDLDICEASLVGCLFERSGNDAIDLMTTRAVVWDTELRDNGDKGISTGEGSSLLATNNLFVGNAIGIQVKDSSQALVLNSTFEGNTLAVDAYKKNWRYGAGGDVLVANSRFAGNERGMTADKYSTVTLRHCFVDQPPMPDTKSRVVLGAGVDDLEQGAAPGLDQDSDFGTLGGAGLEGGAAMRDAWKRVDPAVRGAQLEQR